MTLREHLVRLMLEAPVDDDELGVPDKPGGKGPTGGRAAPSGKDLTKGKFNAFKRLQRIKQMQRDREEDAIDDRNRKYRQQLAKGAIGGTSMGKASKGIDVPPGERVAAKANPFEPKAVGTVKDMPASAGGLGIVGKPKPGQTLAPPDPKDVPVWASSHVGAPKKAPKPPKYDGKFFGQAAMLGKQREWKNTSWHEIKRDITSPRKFGRVEGWGKENVWVWDDKEWLPAAAFDIKYGKGVGSEFGEPKRKDVAAKLQKDPHTKMPELQPKPDVSTMQKRPEHVPSKPGANPLLSYDPSKSKLPKDVEGRIKREKEKAAAAEKEKEKEKEKKGLAAKPKLKMKGKLGKKKEGVDEGLVMTMMRRRLGRK